MTPKTKRGGPIPGSGRRALPLSARKADPDGKVRIRIDPAREMVISISPEDRALAQRLMLRDWPGVRTVEELPAYALRRLAETTGD